MKYNKFIQKFKKLRAGLLTNQSAFGFSNDYHFEFYRENLTLRTIFFPEHGLFGELQDQVSGDSLKYKLEGIETVNLYGETEKTLYIDPKYLQELDLIIIDIRDVGSRYYTFLTTAHYILQSIHQWNLENQEIQLLIVDSPNPIGKKVEGSPLDKKYESFVGIPSVVHRHGLSPAELLLYYIHEFNLRIKPSIIPIGDLYPSKVNDFNWIMPSPNIPSIKTCYVYTGQCLLEGTNLSEGRGTTKPFEIFGAPFVQYRDKVLLYRLIEPQKSVMTLRPLAFIPTFHKYANQVCGGYQIIIHDKSKFHSLLFSLHLIRTFREIYPNEFDFLKGVYEFRSDRPAIELLVGDDLLLSYLNGQESYRTIKEYLKVQENMWTKKIKQFRLKS